MMKKHLLTPLFALLSLVTFAQGVTLTGTVTDQKKGEPLPYIKIVLYHNGVLGLGTETDFDGKYRITNVDPGTYTLKATSDDKAPVEITDVKLTTGLIKLDLKMRENSEMLGVATVIAYKVPIVAVDATSQGHVFVSEDIAKLPMKDVNSIVATTAGVSSNAKGDKLNIRGSRDGGTVFIIDGVRVGGTSTVPVNGIEQLEVITGGLGAKYGDVIGGVVAITTKGPARKFSGGVELETSQYLDGAGYNFANINLSGPILTRSYLDKTKTKIVEPIIGFRISGQLRRNLDNEPSNVPIYRVKEDVLKNLEAHPWTVIGANSRVATAERLQASDFDILKIHPGNKNAQYDVTGKIDARINKAMDVTLSGTVYKIDDQFTPTNWQVFNSDNNPTRETTRYRTNFRFRHRLGSSTAGKKSSGTTVENAQYQIQAGYEVGKTVEADARHGLNFFNYGYIGKFNTAYQPVFATDTSGTREVGFRQVLTGMTLSDINPVLANYNRDSKGNPLDVDASGNNLNVLNGLYLQTNLKDVWNTNFHRNVGQVYDRYRKQENIRTSGQASLNFDIIPNGDKDRAHNVEMGFFYEQRTDRDYDIRPFELWRIADGLQNGNINGTGVDTTKKIGDTLINNVVYPLYAPLENKDILNKTDIRFYKNFRDKFNLPYLKYADINSYTPTDFSLSMFTARELNDASTRDGNAILNYQGFDYLGNRIAAGKYSFNDFFTVKNENGVRLFPVAPIQPLYIAGYIQDKFRYKDMIFSLGVRVDRFDANTKVLKDQYSLYDIMTAKDYYQNILKKTKPANIGDDYKVYLTSNTFGKTTYSYKESDIKGYRTGDTWFTNKGQPIDPISLFGESAVANAKYAADTFPTIQQVGYDPNISFTDYKPQTNIMPRLAFSFPIGDKANFFAHYDVLTGRPANNSVTPLDYFYFDERASSNTQENANLKPERTIDYEVGFQQELTKTTGVKISAYYKELRDLIQLRYIKYLPPPLKTNEYQTYDNVDFGTVKGFSFAYDLRRTANLSAQLSYTLQFADGTGSDPTSQNGINKKGNIRTLSPLSYDERHRIAVNLDYRFDENAKIEWLKNFGANVQLVTVSGRPYTKRRQPQPFGSSQIDGQINGTRLPWNFNMDMRIDKTITLVKTAKRPLNLNIYLRMQNVLNTKNVAGVYAASGSPDNDGYLTSSRGKSELLNTEASRGAADLEAYKHSYLMRMLNPDFYYLPRRIFLGCSFDF